MRTFAGCLFCLALWIAVPTQAALDMTCRTTQFGGVTGTPTIECVFEWGFLDEVLFPTGHMLCWAWDNDSDAMGLRSYRFNARAVSGNSFDCWISETVRPHPCNCTLEGIGGLYLVVPFPIEIPLIVIGIPHRDTPVWDTHTRILP